MIHLFLTFFFTVLTFLRYFSFFFKDDHDGDCDDVISDYYSSCKHFYSFMMKEKMMSIMPFYGKTLRFA